MDRHAILFVDDEENILNAMKRVFRKEGYSILVANSGADALKLFDAHEISLVISDQRMPNMTGVELLEKVREVSPDTVRIMLTGYADVNAIVASINKGKIFRFISKPWNDEDVKLVVRDALRQLDLKRENERLTVLTRKQNEELQELNAGLERKVMERTGEIREKNNELERLYKELKKGFYETIKVMVGQMELLNPLLGSHSKRVAVMTRNIGRAMGLEGNELSEIEIAALLHDIGLMGMPGPVAMKGVDSMSIADKKMYMEHPLRGQATLNIINELKQVGVLVNAHHERLDGKGFPEGLAGEAIPLGSRIIAVADAYDRIVNSEDIYSDDPPQKRALDHIAKFNGTMFDPEVVSRFFGYLKKADSSAKAALETNIPMPELKAGMVLSRDICSGKGKLLIRKKTVLDGAQIAKLRDYASKDPVGDIFIYTRK